MPRSDRSLNKTERLFALVLLLQNRLNMSSRDLRTLDESGVPVTYAEFTELQPDASLRVDVEQARAVAEMYDAVTA